MYCSRCHAGSEHATPGPCRQCGGRLDREESPFTPKPLGKGSGNANGKTAKRRQGTIIKTTTKENRQ